jgi:hypothetical protein
VQRGQIEFGMHFEVDTLLILIQHNPVEVR